MTYPLIPNRAPLARRLDALAYLLRLQRGGVSGRGAAAGAMD